VPESRDPAAAGKLDWLGAALATFGLGGIVYGLIEAPQRGWTSPDIVAALTLGAAALVAFLRVERRHPAPMLPLGLFRSRTFTGTNSLTFFLYAALGGGLFFVPLNLIQVQGYSATAAGAALLPFILLIFVLSRWAGGLIGRYGARAPLVIGSLVATIAYLLYAFPSVGGSYWVTFFPGTVVLGLGMAICVAPLTTTVMSSVEPAHAGTASGVNNAASRVAALLAIALFGVILRPVFDAALDQALSRAALDPTVLDAIARQRDKLAAIELPRTAPAEALRAARLAIGEAFVVGFRWVMVLSALLCLASALVAWWSIDGTRARSLTESRKSSLPR
jgi:predicted MFS family arabinose efflux permease